MMTIHDKNTIMAVVMLSFCAISVTIFCIGIGIACKFCFCTSHGGGPHEEISINRAREDGSRGLDGLNATNRRMQKRRNTSAY